MSLTIHSFSMIYNTLAVAAKSTVIQGSLSRNRGYKLADSIAGESGLAYIGQ